MFPKQKSATLYNAQMKNLVNELRTLDHKVHLVHTSVSQWDLVGILHPGAKGHEKIAHDFFEALGQAYERGQITPPVGGANETDSGACPVLPTWIEMGQ